MKQAYWIWYPGDFELYHGMKQNFSRFERGYEWPAFWKSEGFRNRIFFHRKYFLKEDTQFCVYAGGVGFVMAGDKKYPFGEMITCPAGETVIRIHLARIEALPCVYIEGTEICSDRGWLVGDFDHVPAEAGFCKYFTEKTQNPCEWEFSSKEYPPVKIIQINGGLLFGFETEITAQLLARGDIGSGKRAYFGESEMEALDLENCYYSWEIDSQTGSCPRCAFRYVFIPNTEAGQIHITAMHQFVDIPVRANFHSDDELLNRIWHVAQHTFMLCSGIFILDGVKRDKWIWAGDAYQSLFVNQYLTADEELEQRTLIALRGNDPVTTHINTIVDYSLLWILSVWKHYESYGNREFLEYIYPKMVSLMDFMVGQTDENGFLVGRKGDWIYIDWAEFDKEGPFCPEQMLFIESLRVMGLASTLIEGDDTPCKEDYAQRYIELKRKTNEYYWDREKGAYIDSFVSGKRNVTRHANIFAVLFDIADDRKKESILEKVIDNPEIPPITTPYFKFFEMDMLCKEGYLAKVLTLIKDYWGGMLKQGAVTFWEEFDPTKVGDEKYDMYGDRFGKSLCHAWAASPIYFLARYYAGLEIKDGGERYEVNGRPDLIRQLDCNLPVREKDVHVHW